MKEGATLKSSSGEISLPREITTQGILPYCKPSELVNFSRASKDYCDLANDQMLWLDLLNHYFKQECEQTEYTLDEEKHPKKLFMELYEKQKHDSVDAEASDYLWWCTNYDYSSKSMEEYREWRNDEKLK